MHSSSNLHIASNEIGKFFKILKIKPIVKSNQLPNQIKKQNQNKYIHILRSSIASRTKKIFTCDDNLLVLVRGMTVDVAACAIAIISAYIRSAIAFGGESNDSINSALQTPIIMWVTNDKEMPIKNKNIKRKSKEKLMYSNEFFRPLLWQVPHYLPWP